METTTTSIERPRILAEIKSQTQQQHDSMEQGGYGALLMSGRMTPEEYKQYLIKFYGFHVPLEEHLRVFTQWSEYGISINARRRTHLLEKDLRALGMTERDIAALPVCTNLPAMDSFPAMCGVMYVMEGSTLGGQIQSRQAQKLFGYTPENGTAYFFGYGAQETGIMWKEFCRLLVAVAGDESTEKQMITAAQETFAALEAWMNEPVPALV